jgi:hypothetical protein
MSIRRLRRLARWKYALRETALIVVGVLIALGVNAWWSQRQDRARERLYINQLSSDAGENERILSSAIAEDSASLAALVSLSAALHFGAPPTESAMDIFDVALRYSDPRPVLGTLDHLVESGAVEIIRAERLRLTILQYTSLMHADLQEVNRHVDLLLAGMRSWVSRQQQAGLDCPMFVATSETENLACEDDFKEAWPALQRDPEYRAAVHAVRVGTWNRLFYLGRMLDETRKFREDVNSSP